MIYVGDIGAELLVQTGIDLTGATTLELKVKKPDLSIETWAAAVPVGGDAADGYIVHTTVSGDLDQSGNYLIQAHRVAAGIDQLGGTFTLTVKDAYA